MPTTIVCAADFNLFCSKPGESTASQDHRTLVQALYDTAPSVIHSHNSLLHEIVPSCFLVTSHVLGRVDRTYVGVFAVVTSLAIMPASTLPGPATSM